MKSKRFAIATCSCHLLDLASAIADLLNDSNAVFYHGGTIDPRSTPDLLLGPNYFDEYQCYETFE